MSDGRQGTIRFYNNYYRITGNSTITVKNTSGILNSILIGNNGTGGVITIYDNTSGSGTIIMQLNLATPSGGLLSASGYPNPILIGPFGIDFMNGLTVVTAGSSNNDITILYE